MPSSSPTDHRYTVTWNGEAVAAVSTVTGLNRANQVLAPPPGAAPKPVSRQSGYTPITLERGVITDPEFARWLRREWTGAPAGEAPPAEIRRDLALEVRDASGVPTVRYEIYRCWPSVYRPGPEDDAGPGIASLLLEHEGWNRDASVAPAPD